MKNNKKSPVTQARRLAFKQSEPELAILITLPMQKAFQSELDAIKALSRELVGIDTPEMVQARVAMESTAQGYRENTPELYGRVHAPAAMFCNGLPTLHAPGRDANCELEETDAALVGSVSSLTLQESQSVNE